MRFFLDVCCPECALQDRPNEIDLRLVVDRHDVLFVQLLESYATPALCWGEGHDDVQRQPVAMETPENLDAISVGVCENIESDR